jgi:hypothetical protein
MIVASSEAEENEPVFESFRQKGRCVGDVVEWSQSKLCASRIYGT